MQRCREVRLIRCIGRIKSRWLTWLDVARRLEVVVLVVGHPSLVRRVADRQAVVVAGQVLDAAGEGDAVVAAEVVAVGANGIS